MEYLDLPISIIYWKTQYGEPLTVEETAQWEAWQAANPDKALQEVLQAELAFHKQFRQRRAESMQRLFTELNAKPSIPEVITPVVEWHRPSWFARNKRVIMAAAVVAGLAIGLVALLRSDDNKSVTYQPAVVAQRPQRPAPSDTALYVNLSNGERFAVGSTDTGVLVSLGTMQLRSKGPGQLLYEAVGAHGEAALIHHTITSVARKLVAVTLADKSVVTLGPGSTLQVNVDDSRGERSVTLEGVARFAVTHDVHRPFIVHAAGVPVQVLGTEFGVMTGDRGFTTVAVKKGSVRVGRGAQVATLQTGQAVQVSASGQISPANGRLQSLLSFSENKFYYTNQTLATIKADIEQWYSVRLLDDNPSNSLATYYFGPVPRDLPLTTVLEKLSRLTGHRFRYEQRP